MRNRLLIAGIGLFCLSWTACSQPVMGASALKVQFGGFNIQGIAEQAGRAAAGEALKRVFPSSEPQQPSHQPSSPPAYKPPPPATKKQSKPVYKPSYETSAPEAAKKAQPEAVKAKSVAPAAGISPRTVALPFSTKVVTSSPEIRPISVPLHNGLPISGFDRVFDTPEAKSMQFDLVRWFVLMHLAARPELFDKSDTALSIAALYLPKEKWDHYFDCGIGGQHMPCSYQLKHARSSQLSLPIGGWKGDNEFSKMRTHKAFVDDYRDVLKSAAPSLPQEIYIVAQANFDDYAAKQGGFPVWWQNGLFSSSSSKGESTLRSLPLAGDYAAPLFINLPKLLPCEPEECERLVTLSPHRILYAVLKLRVTEVNSGSTTIVVSPGGGGGTAHSKAELMGDMALFADKGLSTLVHTFSAPKPILAAQDQGDNASAEGFDSGPVILNTDTLRLLWMKYDPLWRKNPRINEIASEMYEGRRRSEMGFYEFAQEDGQWPGYDPWGPYFQANAISTQQSGDVQKFLKWSERRVQTLPRPVVARFWLSKGLGQPTTNLVSGHVDLGDSRSGNTASSNDDVAKYLDSAGVAPSANIVSINFSTAGGIKSAALVFPEALNTYAINRDPGKPLPPGIGSVFSEIVMNIDSVRFWPEGAPAVMLMQVTPQEGRIVKGTAVIAQAPLRLQGAASTDTFNPDVLGVMLGMPIATAEGLVREYLSPDSVEDWQSQEPGKGYARARDFESMPKKERIILYLSSTDTVAGIERVLVIKPDYADLVATQLIEKYGPPKKHNKSSGKYEWWQRQYADYCYAKDSPRTNRTQIEGVFKGKVYVGTQALALSGNSTRVNADVLAQCGPILDVSLSSVMRLHLYDHKAEAQASADVTQVVRDDKPKFRF